MRIGNGPRLSVPRGVQARPRWARWGWNGYHSYEQHLAEQRERIRRLPHHTRGDAKQQTTWLSSLKPGEHYRRVDGHGRSTGPRLVATADDRRGHGVQVRRVARQDEDMHSRMSRMLKASHRFFVRNP